VRARRGPTADGWRHFYRLVKDAVQERSVADIQRRVVSPLALVRNESRRKRAALRNMRLLNANALGLLVADGLASESIHSDGLASPTSTPRWKSVVTRSIALMDAVMHTVNTPEHSPDGFDASVAAITNDDPYYERPQASADDAATALKPADVAQRLQQLLRHALPTYTANFNAVVRANGRPSRLVRYWLPATVLLVSSTTLFRIAINRREEIVSWIRELGQTVIDFWTNWVVEPTKKVVGTIRHD
jgi:nuclear-control-of-ATPase protein 2